MELMGLSGGSPTTEQPPRSPLTTSAEGSRLLYAQCWEDADVLLDALEARPGGTYISIASGGDNSLALLARDPERVIAIDVNPAQLACVELRVAAYGCLDHDELLEFVGSRESRRREHLYRSCRSAMQSPAARDYWDRRLGLLVAHGLGGTGRFERYFRLFRTLVLPLIHGRARVAELLAPKSRADRESFYERAWNNRRWRLLVATFFSRAVMGLLGRERAFFEHARQSLADQVLERSRYAFVELDTSDNPYLQWIVTGTHGAALPFALRAENVAAIRRNLGRLELRQVSLDRFADDARRTGHVVDGLNLSDVFEYMPEDEYRASLARVVTASSRGARLVYWNMLVPRSRPPELADRLVPLEERAAELFARDKAFFYQRLNVEAVL